MSSRAKPRDLLFAFAYVAAGFRLALFAFGGAFSEGVIPNQPASGGPARAVLRTSVSLPARGGRSAFRFSHVAAADCLP
jgi:hypothetical protein